MSEYETSIIELGIDLDDCEDFQALPDGPYTATLVGAELRTGPKGGQYYYTMWLVPTDQYPVDYDVANNPEGTLIQYSRLSYPSSDNRRSITGIKKFYRALGMKLKTSVIDTSKWEGKKAKLILKEDEYNGSPTNTIVAIEHVDD